MMAESSSATPSSPDIPDEYPGLWPVLNFDLSQRSRCTTSWLFLIERF
jgi:hypothetical protein